MGNRLPLHILSAATVLLFAATACTQDDLGGGTLPEGEYPLVIRATGLQAVATPASTRATVDGDWQGVQTVALSVGGTVKEYDVTASDADGYKTAILSSDTDPFWWTSREDITVSAWWPYGTTMPDVVVKADQSTKAGFEGSDFISAEAQAVQFDHPMLEFSHRTARITVHLKPGAGIPSVSGADVYVTGLGTDNGNPATIRTYAPGGDTYEALTAPQTVKVNTPFIQVDLGGGTYYFRPQSDVVLEAGSRYTYTVSVTATGLTLEGCTIGDWTNGSGESGTAEDLGYFIQDDGSYTVYTANGLKEWAEAVQTDPTINCTLTADIDLTGKEWTPIGDNDNRYTGTFDGGNYTITGLTVNQEGTNYVGLIGFIGSDGTVKNVKLENVNITGSYYVGGVVGYNSGSVTACTSSGSVSGSYYVGGVVGGNFGSVTACTSSGSVSGSIYVGGVVGDNYGTVTACTASGSVEGRSNVGGVVGYNSSGSVTACTSSGSVEGSIDVGGVVGDNYGSVTACYWSDYAGNGIGSGNGGETTLVDGTDVTWADAVDAMNAALTGNDYQWVLGPDDLPVLQSNQ